MRRNIGSGPDRAIYQRFALWVGVWAAATSGMVSAGDTPLKTVRVVSGLFRPLFVTFAPGETEQEVTVLVKDDPYVDANETVVLRAFAGENHGLVGTGRAEIRITDPRLKRRRPDGCCRPICSACCSFISPRPPKEPCPCSGWKAWPCGRKPSTARTTVPGGAGAATV